MPSSTRDAPCPVVTPSLSGLGSAFSTRIIIWQKSAKNKKYFSDLLTLSLRVRGEGGEKMEQAQKAMKELEKVLSQLPIEMDMFMYLDLRKAIQQAFCQQDYSLVCSLCTAACEHLGQHG